MTKVDPQLYPKCKYNAQLPPVLVKDLQEERALGVGWYDYPHQVTEQLDKDRDAIVQAQVVIETVKGGPGRPRKVQEAEPNETAE